MTNDLVSIIMPSYNTGKYISESIHSVLNQTYKNWELIIIDDCSTDNTVSVVNSFMDKRIRFFQNKTNSGAAVSRNVALTLSKGRWIAFLDSDDLWVPEKLEHQIKFMEQNRYSFSYSNYIEIDSFGNERGIIVTGPNKIIKSKMYDYCWPGCLTVMYDRKIVGDIKIADIKKNNDYAMWLKVCQKTDCYLVNEVLAKYRRGRLGSVSTQSFLTMISWHYRLFHEAENQNAVFALINTCRNILFGIYKKVVYVKKYRVKKDDK